MHFGGSCSPSPQRAPLVTVLVDLHLHVADGLGTERVSAARYFCPPLHPTLSYISFSNPVHSPPSNSISPPQSGTSSIFHLGAIFGQQTSSQLRPTPVFIL